MLIAFLIFIICLLTAACAAVTYYLWKFATIIMVFEDDLEDSLEAMNNVDNTIKSLLEMQLFFDSPEVKEAVKNILDEVTLTRSILNLTIKKFTDRSTQKYITVWDDDDDSDDDKKNNEREDNEREELEQARMFLNAQRQAMTDGADPLQGMYGVSEQQQQQRQGTILSTGGRLAPRR